jgi:hypothetical protein
VDLGRLPGGGAVTRTQRRIEEHRRGPARVQVLDAAGRPRPGVPVWVEQESHAFAFGCAVPDLAGLADGDRGRYRARWAEVFNRAEPAAGVVRVEVADRLHLGLLHRELDRQAGRGLPLEVHVTGRSVGAAEPDEPRSARRLVELYTLCFAHPAVAGIFWHGLWDGEADATGGLLRLDFSPRPAFRLLQKLIDVVWHTRDLGRTDAEGMFAFRGFFGEYRVGVRAGGWAEVACFSLRSGDGTPWRVVASGGEENEREPLPVPP